MPTHREVSDPASADLGEIILDAETAGPSILWAVKHVVVGLLLVVIGLWGMVAWWDVFGLVMRGLVPLGALVIGLIATLSGYYRLTPEDRYDDRYEYDDPAGRG